MIGAAIIISGRRSITRAAGRLLMLLGIFAIAVSATPLPLWAYILWILSLCAWLCCRLPRYTVRSKAQIAAIAGLGCCTLAALAWELSYQVAPAPMSGSWKRLVVIGDSLSAAEFTEGGDPWPTLLAREHPVHVENRAFNGAMAGSSERKVKGEDLAGALVLLEIGGNDLFGATPADQFAADLERLLQKVCRSDNSVLMLELPLPPLYNRYGEIQRRLARRHAVPLVPKRFFAQVLAGSDSTVDGLHLGPAGHRKMANMIWHFVGPALTNSRVTEQPAAKSKP
jgi:lysophospholipase L1-like esterase